MSVSNFQSILNKYVLLKYYLAMKDIDVIVQKVKVSVAILTDLNVLPYQTAVIKWRNFNKDICTNCNWIELLKIKHNYDLYKTFIFIKKFLYKFRIIIFYEYANLKTANIGWQKYTKAKNTNGKG